MRIDMDPIVLFGYVLVVIAVVGMVELIKNR